MVGVKKKNDKATKPMLTGYRAKVHAFQKLILLQGTDLKQLFGNTQSLFICQYPNLVFKDKDCAGSSLFLTAKTDK